MIRQVLLALALLASLPVAREARAQSPIDEARHFVDRWRKESRIERKMVMADLRGMLGFFKKPAPPDWSERTYGKGQLEVIQGVPILRIAGTPEEMAAQEAHLVGKEARALVEHYLP